MVGCWHGYLSAARCTFAYGPADTTATHCLLLQEIQIGFGFTFPVPAHSGSPGQNPEDRKMVVVVTIGLVHDDYDIFTHELESIHCLQDELYCGK